MAEKIKLLVIDDEEDFTFFLKLNLEKTGEYEVLTAGEGKTGIELAKSKNPDLILLDIHMPGLHGSEVVEILSKEESTKNIPVMFLTASSVFSKEDNSIEAEPTTVYGRPLILKPVSSDDLINKIKPILEKR